MDYTRARGIALRLIESRHEGDTVWLTEPRDYGYLVGIEVHTLHFNVWPRIDHVTRWVMNSDNQGDTAGVWHNPSGGFDFDICRHYRDRTIAVIAGLLNNQQAIWDIENTKQIFL